MRFFTLIALSAAILSTEAIKIEQAKYDGDLPEHFDSKKGGDAYMEKIIKEYADKDDKGVFYVSKANALKYGKEVMVEDVGMHSFWARLHIDDNF